MMEALGHIDQIDKNHIIGWIHASGYAIRPQLFVDGRPGELLEWQTPREDVAAALGIAANTGFRFQVSGLSPASEVSLYALSTERIAHVQTRSLPHTLCESSPLEQLRQARSIAAMRDAVAITCWEGSHNPVGRAKVLYDIVKTARPAVIFTYLFNTFGGQLWLPVAQSDTRIVSVPWEEREVWHTLIRDLGIHFRTVWICKPRLPSFMLAGVLGTPKTRYILDIDDNESAFSRNESSQDTFHGSTSESLVRYCMRSVPSRTVANVALREMFGGKLVRHAREISPERHVFSQSKYKKIAFIGTARTHKRLREAARAIQDLNAAGELRVVFHVYGDIPPQLQRALAEMGVVTRGHVSPDTLSSTLAGMDAVLAGFPATEAEETAISAWQISSKISDALSVGIPVLVPETPAVADLSSVPGVFLFNEENFAAQCVRALTRDIPVELPVEFTHAGAYQNFIAEEKKSRPGVTFPFAASSTRSDKAAKRDTASPPALVLLWKQHDAGVYGRRVDQIARAYRREYPEHKVFILELLSDSQKAVYTARRNSFASDAEHILSLAEAKLGKGYASPEGVHHVMLPYSDKKALRRNLLRCMVEHGWSPEHTVLVVFPLLDAFAAIHDMLAAFPLLVDFVDNQLYWATDEQKALDGMAQYMALARMGRHCLFNSEENLAAFRANGILGETTPTTLAPNWYLPPKNFSSTQEDCSQSSHLMNSLGSGLHAFYSGNMNDRINWDVLAQAGELPNVTVHLVGAAQRVQEKLLQLMLHPGIVYHGPHDEAHTLALLRRMDVALIPHCRDNCSQFMNPMKTNMYLAAGIPVLSLRVSGVDAYPGVTFCDSEADMLHRLATFRRSPPRRPVVGQAPDLGDSARKYFAVITALLRDNNI